MMGKKITGLAAALLAAAMIWNAPAGIWAAAASETAASEDGIRTSDDEEDPAQEDADDGTCVQDDRDIDERAQEESGQEDETGQEDEERTWEGTEEETGPEEEEGQEEHTDAVSLFCAPSFSIDIDITDQGILDYRTYADDGRRPQLHIELSGDAGGLRYGLIVDDTDVICVDQAMARLDKDLIFMDGTDQRRFLERYGSGQPPLMYMTGRTELALRVNGTGRTGICAVAIDEAGDCAVAWGVVEVRNSPLHDEDFCIEVCREATDGEKATERYGQEDWSAYLESHGGWVNGTIAVQLSQTGKRIYTALTVEHSGQSYSFWAEDPARRATTAGGKRSFSARIDTDAPVFSGFSTQSRCYEPTMTKTRQYFAEDLVLKGSFVDNASGVSRIEYTTDLLAGDGKCAWQEAIFSDEGAGRAGFEIRLSDGCYPAIAVRAYDRAGNVSVPAGSVNEDGAFIQAIVDKSVPIVDISATAGGRVYIGEDERWTNKDVVFSLSAQKGSCPYAGIYGYGYRYVKIGDAVQDQQMDDAPEDWTVIPAGDPDRADSSGSVLEVDQDRNGYYHFQAVSRSGVCSEQAVSRRVLIQHEAAELCPAAAKGVLKDERQNGWYNRASGVPEIHFGYPGYDTGAVSKEYDAPVTLHYTLRAQTEGHGDAVRLEGTAVMGVLSCSDTVTDQEGRKTFRLTRDDLDRHVLTFGHDKATGYAQDGIYTLEYWLTDKAGNTSEKQKETYKIDTHGPTMLQVQIGDTLLAAGSSAKIRYGCFYGAAVTASATAEYGISGKGSIRILRARKIGAWNGMGAEELDNGDDFCILPNIRCVVYVRAQDQAGNVSEGWTDGIVVDDMAPNASDGSELIVAPEGANAHGFFNKDVAVRVSVKDAPEDGDCASLWSVRSAVGKDGADMVADQELFLSVKERPTGSELDSASSFDTVQVVDAAENESNEAYIAVTAQDRAGNSRRSVQPLKIDITRPEVSLSFDDVAAANGSFYHEGRTARILVRELNFDPGSVEIQATRDGQPVEPALTGWTHEGVVHEASITFSEDGDYTMAVRCTDLADNMSETVWADGFTIDRTAPEMTIALEARQSKSGAKEDHFSADVTAVVTIKEHNFHEDGLVLDGVPFLPGGTWSHEGDIHTYRMVFSEDAHHKISAAYTDLAGNMAAEGVVSREFVIDTEPPKIQITGVADGSANAGEVTPVIDVRDADMDPASVQITVGAATGGAIKNDITIGAIDGSGTEDAGYRFTLCDMTKKPDDIYHLTVSACDRAGNRTMLAYRFSLNRNGSTYDLSGLARLMAARYLTYDSLEDIQIVEMNIDKVVGSEIYISRNGAIGYKAQYTQKVEGSEDTGYTYHYDLPRENFEQEGIYRLSLYSRDRAGNEVNDRRDINGEEIVFVIDDTPPRAVIDGVASGMLYDVEAQEARIVVTDNFKLAGAEFMLVNEEREVLEQWDYMALCEEGGTMRITIPQYKGRLSLIYRLRDAAGNEIETFQGQPDAPCGFLVTTDKLVQFMDRPWHTPAGRALPAAGSGIAAICIIARRRVCGRIMKR